MQEEILSLKLRISEQEEVLKGTVQRLRSTSRTKESMEHFIVNQRKCFCLSECVHSFDVRARLQPPSLWFSAVSRTRDVLKKARTNLEVSEVTERANGVENLCVCATDVSILCVPLLCVAPESLPD